MKKLFPSVLQANNRQWRNIQLPGVSRPSPSLVVWFTNASDCVEWPMKTARTDDNGWKIRFCRKTSLYMFPSTGIKSQTQFVGSTSSLWTLSRKFLRRSSWEAFFVLFWSSDDVTQFIFVILGKDARTSCSLLDRQARHSCRRSLQHFLLLQILSKCEFQNKFRMTWFWAFYLFQDWTRKKGWRVIHSRKQCVPGDEGYPRLSDRTNPSDYAARGFNEARI